MAYYIKIKLLNYKNCTFPTKRNQNYNTTDKGKAAFTSFTAKV